MFIKTNHIPASFGATYKVPIPKCNVKQEAQLSQRDRAAPCLNFG